MGTKSELQHPPADSDEALDRPSRALRERAEALDSKSAAQSPQDQEALWPKAAQEVLHELRVHQIELVMQNEELQQTQLKLDAARARYFDLYNLAPVGYVSVSKSGEILQANLIACTLLGRARDTLIGHPVSPFIHKEDQDLFYLNRKQALESGEARAFELRMVKHDGSLFWAHLEAAAGQDADGAAELRIVLTDVSERRSLQGELRRATDKLGAIASNVSGMMFELTQRGEKRQLTYVSEEARALFGFAADDLPQALKLMLLAIVRDDDSELFLQSLERSAQTLSLWTWGGQVIGPQGESRWVQLRATPRTNDNGSLVWDGIINDVTAVKTNEMVLNDTRQLLRDISVDHEAIREEERIRIARELHDELGQVLTGVKLHLAAMGLRVAPGDTALKTQAAYVMRQVDQAIAMTRSTVLNLRPPALDHGLGAAVVWLAHQFRQRTGIDCRVNLPEADVELSETRATALFRILQESLTNIARHAEASAVGVDLRALGPRLHLRVIDNGKGFVQDHLVAGRSFGLLGMRERVAMLGGHFEINSTEGVGTSILIEVAIEGGAE